MPNAYISGTGFYVPPRVVTNTMLRTEYGIDTTEEWIVKRTGIEERRYSEPGVATSDLAVPAAEDAIRRAGITKQDIDMILFATLSPDAAFPGCGVYLQQKLGLCDGDDATFVPAMDIRNQCSGFLYSLATATSMVKSGAVKNVLVVRAETHSAAIDLSDRGRTVASLFGDGAGAVVVSATDEDRAAEAIARQYDLTPDEARSLVTSLGALEARMDDPRLAGRDLEPLIRAGLARLDDDELLEHQSIESLLTRRSDELCAGLSTGRASQTEVLRALAMQDESIRRAWFRHVEHAIVYELEGTGAAIPADPEQLASEAFERALGTLPEDEADSLWRRMGSAASEDPHESCDGYRATEAVLSLMTPTEQATVLRALHAMSTSSDAR